MNDLAFSSALYDDLTTARLASVDGDVWSLEDGGKIRVALSCLLAPQAGDLVLVANTAQGRFLLHVLERAAPGPLSVGSFGHDLSLSGRAVTVKAAGTMRLVGARDCEISAAAGRLDIKAGEMRTTVLGALFQRAESHVAQFGEWLVSVKDFYRLHAGRQHLTSDAEMKIDAEIIHMG